MRVYVARHGETTWNLAGRYQGRRESGLTALGVQQGFALADAFAELQPRIERIVASPLLRCSATARFVADRLNIALETDDRLLEIAHGTWEGRLRDEIAADDPERFRAWKERPGDVRFENGETLAQVRDRWRNFAASFPARAPALVVTHDAVVRVAILDAQHRSLNDLWNVNVENAGFAEFDVSVAAHDERAGGFDMPASESDERASEQNGQAADLEARANRWTLVRESVNGHLAGLRAAIQGQAL